MALAWQRLGDRAIRFARIAGNPAAIVRTVRGWPHVVDVVVGHNDIAVYFDREPVQPCEPSRLARDGAVVAIDPDWIAALDGACNDTGPVRQHVLRCVYDGADLEAVAQACGMEVREVVARHCSTLYVVETMGFLPGFGYLAGLDARLELARRPTPRPRVPALSIGIAGRHTAVYPFESPGGWHLIGRVLDLPMFDPNGARLGLGDWVRFAP